MFSRKIVRKSALTLGLCVGLGLSGGGSCFASGQLMDLSEAIQVGLANNPQIDIAYEQCIQGQGLVTQAQSGYLPQVSLSGEASQVYIEDLQPDDEDSVLHGSINLSQLIYDFGKTTGAIDSSEFSLLASEAIMHQYIQDVILEIRSAFYKVLRTRRLVDVAKEAVDNYDKHLYRAERYFQAGVRTRIDVTNAKVNLSNAKLSLVEAESDYKSARVELENALGKNPYAGQYILVDSAGQLDKLASQKPQTPEELSSLLTVAYEKRADMRQLKYLSQASEADIDQADSGYFPSISAFAGYDEYSTDLETSPDTWNVGVGFTWQIFSGFETEGRVVESKAKLREVNAATRRLELGITEEVTESYLRAVENRDGVDLADESLELAKENLELAIGRYESGLSDMIEFNDAQLNLTTAQSNLVRTYYNYLTSLARIEYATGVTKGLGSIDESRLGTCQVPVWLAVQE